MKRLILIFISIILFPASYGICDWFHYYHINPWYRLREYLYELSILFAAGIAMFEKDEKYEKFVKIFLCVFIFGELFPQLLDRTCCDYDFHWYDPLYSCFALISAFRAAYPVNHKKIFSKLIGVKLYDKIFNLLK